MRKILSTLCVLIALVCSLAVEAQIPSEHELFGSREEVSVVVVLRDNYSMMEEYESDDYIDDFEIQKAMIAEQQQNVLDGLKLKSSANAADYDFELTNTYATVNGFAGKLRKTGFQKLRQNQNVLKIYKPFRIKALLNESAKVINADKAWEVAFNSENITGKGETICIPDTGVDYTHAALGGCTTEQFLAGTCPKVIAGYDFANDDNDPIDDNGHGTHVAGIAASADIQFRGIAPDANIAVLKIFDEFGGGESDDLISAIDWCVNNASKFNISVISMSLGSFESFSSHCDDDDPLLTSSISNAIANNIAVVAAAGNSGEIDGVESPACITNVTAVGSSTKNDEISSFSDRWALPMLLAPGESIISASLGEGFISLDGTSMATPHVAGAFALLRQFKRLQQGIILKPSQIESTLISSGKLIQDTFGSGLFFRRIDVYAALQLLNQTVFTFEEESKGLKIMDVDVKVDGKKSSNIKDGEEIRKEAGPNSKVEFRITVKNDFSKNSNVKLSNIAVKAVIEGIDEEADLEEESEDFDLAAQRGKTVTFKFSIPQNVDEDNFDVTIEAKGEDENGTLYEQKFRTELEVEKEKHDLRLSDFGLTPSIVSCSKIINFNYKIINLGQEDEENAFLEVRSDKLGLELAEKGLKISSGIEDNAVSRYGKLEIGNEESGDYEITANVYSSNSKLMDSKKATIRVADCVEEAREKEEEVVLLFGQPEEKHDIKALPSKTTESETQKASPKNAEETDSRMQLLAMSSLAFAVFFIFVVAVWYSY